MTSPIDNVVSVEFHAPSNTFAIFVREDDKVTMQRSRAPHCFVADKPNLVFSGNLPTELQGELPLKYMWSFADFGDYRKALREAQNRAKEVYGENANDHIWQRNPVDGFMIKQGVRLFAGMHPEELKVVSIDLETFTGGDKLFPDAKDKSDRIIVASLADNRGKSFVLGGSDWSEKDIITRLCAIIAEEDYDVICGHNLLGFDMPYLHERAVQLGLSLPLGRDGSGLRVGPTRARRMLSDNEYFVFGRHLIDTLPLLMSWDITSRSLSNWQLKSAVVELGLSEEDRRDFARENISAMWLECPDEVLAYGEADARDALVLYQFLCPPEFYQTQLLPLPYQQTVISGTGTKVDLLLQAGYLSAGYSLPVRGALAGGRGVGGLTEALSLGMHSRVYKVDVASLYPSICLSYGIKPRTDELGLFLSTLRELRDRRLQSKARLRHLTKGSLEYRATDAMQNSFKVLINSFYGMLGTAGLYFCDGEAASRITESGQSILLQMVDNIRAAGGLAIEIDTDGIFLTWPTADADPQEIVDTVSAGLDEGIRVEFDGYYDHMYSYASKNYMLLAGDSMVKKGVVFRSRRLTAFQNEFIERVFLLLCREDTCGASQFYHELRQRIETNKLELTDIVTSHPVEKPWDEYGTLRQKNKNKFLDLVYWRQDRERWSVRSRIAYYHASGGADGVKLAEEFSADPDKSFYLELLRKTAEKFIYTLPPDAWAQVFSDEPCRDQLNTWNFSPAERLSTMADYQRVLRGDHRIRLF
ncbi:MAG TPA: DNA-directed DNA polymerase [Bacillota bacterium]|nr:DNA-directed DNA polymerase [Bacillota bacterium]